MENKKKVLYIILAIVIVAIIAVIAYMMLNNSNINNIDNTTDDQEMRNEPLDGGMMPVLTQKEGANVLVDTSVPLNLEGQETPTE